MNSAENKYGNRLRTLAVWATLVVVVGALAAVAILLAQYRAFQYAPLDLPEEGLVYPFSPGMSLNRLARSLHEQGILEHPRFLVVLGRERGLARRLQAGEYRFTPGMTPVSLLEMLAEGGVIQYSLTIIEGQTFAEMMQQIRTHPVLVSTLGELEAGEIMARIGHPGEHPEGRFLPDTYKFPGKSTDAAFLRRAYTAMETQLAMEWERREAGLPLDTPYEALILASIVEKETGVAEERPQIAGVFIRRLKKGMRLQTDPTVIYGLGADFDGDIRYRDLRTDTPYNTYTRYGLPPTPIAMPGIDAIRAVLHPEPGDTLYFVSMGNGRHVFSRTLKEHNRAVDQYQRGKTGKTGK